MEKLKYKHLVAMNELKAVTWLLSLGYDVFKNVSWRGSVDLVAIKDGEVLLLDVKAAGPPMIRPARENKMNKISELHSDLDSASEDLPGPTITSRSFQRHGHTATEEQTRLGVKFLLVGEGRCEIIEPRKFGEKPENNYPKTRASRTNSYMADFSDL